MITVIIPTYNRVEQLKETLLEYNKQTLKDFECIVVNDGGIPIEINKDDYRYPITYLEKENGGPASARNMGANHAKYDILFFTGDDCPPHNNLLFRHWYTHLKTDKPKAVQGYTVWHYAVANEFQRYLTDIAGIQSNYNAAKDKNGKWKETVNGFCLTTNWSIHKDIFIPFDEQFKAAAWEDIDLGYRLNMLGETTLFDPLAINYHYHRYSMPQYAQRQKTEGYWRIRLCLNHPEMAGSLIDPYAIRALEDISDTELEHRALQLKYASAEYTQKKYEMWTQYLQAMSVKGIIEGLKYHKALEAIKHVHHPESCHHIFAGVSGLLRGDLSFAIHCSGWLIKNIPDNWAAWAYDGELKLEIGDKAGARDSFKRSISISYSDWASERLEELD